MSIMKMVAGWFCEVALWGVIIAATLFVFVDIIVNKIIERIR